MRRVKGRDTTPELAFRKALWARGLRYTLGNAALAGKPDLVLPKRRLAVFIDGDFWHGNQWSRRGHASLEAQFARIHSKGYWVPKIRRTMERDRRNTAHLVAGGWRVLRFWESELAANLSGCVEQTVRAVREEPAACRASCPPERTFAEFCAGAGLVRLGLARQGWTAAFATDSDPRMSALYAANFPQGAPTHYRLADVQQLRGSDVPAVTLATASFPCTNGVHAGAHSGLAGEAAGALFAFLDILREMGERRPPLVLLENGAGLFTAHGGADFRRVLLALNALDYAVDAFILDDAHFVPRSRPRLFIVGAQGLTETAITEAEPPWLESPLRPAALARRMRAETDVRWRVMDLPPPPPRETTLVDVLEELPTSAPEWWSDAHVGRLLQQLSPRHAALTQAAMAGEQRRVGTAFSRVRQGRWVVELRLDGVAGCLCPPRAGGSRQILLELGNQRCRARTLTPRECARLHGMDDACLIALPAGPALCDFGDTVCVPAIDWIADRYLNVVVSQLMHSRLLMRAL